MKTVEQIAELFKGGIDCSQVVLGECAEKLGISVEEAYKMAACFGGGMGAGGTCGAFVGAMIAIGMKYGHGEVGQMEQKNIMAAKRGEFFSKLSEKYPSSLCKDVLGYDLTKPEDMNVIMEQGLLFTRCPQAVADVLAVLEDMI